MKDKNNFGNNAEITASDLPAELVEQLKGKSADKTPVLSKRPDTHNPPKESGQYRLTQSLKTELNDKLTKVFDPRARQTIERVSLVSDRENLYSTNDVFSELEKERDEISKRFPRTPQPEKGIDTDYPRKADTNRPPSGNTPRPGFSEPSSAKEQDSIPTPIPARKSPIPNGNHRTISGQFEAQSNYADVGYTGTKRFASPKAPSLEGLEDSENQAKSQSNSSSESENENDGKTLIDIINGDIKS
jgi:hypothetical protein